MGLRDQILNADDLGVEIMDVPEWDAKIEVRGMSGAERAAFTERTRPGGEARTNWIMTELLIACVYDPDTGERVFEPADRDMLNSKNAKVMERVFVTAARLSGIGVEDELEGKSDAPPNFDGS